MAEKSTLDSSLLPDCGYKVSLYNIPKFFNLVDLEAQNHCIGVV